MAFEDAVIASLIKDYHIEVIRDECPVEDHQSNGVVEHAVGEVAGQTRILNAQLKDDYKIDLPTDHPIYTRMIHHAGWIPHIQVPSWS